MELRRAGKKNSWGGGEDGASPAAITCEADGFEIGHFGCGVRLSIEIDGSFEESNSLDWERISFEKTSIGLKNDPRADDGDAICFRRNLDQCADWNHIGGGVG